MNIYKFTEALKNRLNEYKKINGYTYFESYEIVATEGKRFFKVFRQEMTGGKANHRAIVCFIDKANGDIYKPASFNAPAKHVRGNILSEHDGMEAFTPDGFVRYL